MERKIEEGLRRINFIEEHWHPFQPFVFIVFFVWLLAYHPFSSIRLCLYISPFPIFLSFFSTRLHVRPSSSMIVSILNDTQHSQLVSVFLIIQKPVSYIPLTLSFFSYLSKVCLLHMYLYFPHILHVPFPSHTRRLDAFHDTT